MINTLFIQKHVERKRGAMLSDDILAHLMALLLTGSLFAPPCLAAPLDSNQWHHPCGTNKQETSAPVSLVRHPAMRALRRVLTQIMIVNDHYDKEEKNIESLYQELNNEFRDAINYSWLPVQQFEWYDTKARCLAKRKRLALVLPALHSALQKYLVTLEEVNRFPAAINEPHETAKIRKRVLFEISKELKRWLCEVETALLSSNMPIPTRTSEDILPRHDLDLWHSDPNHTSSLIQAWGVLNAYHRFAKDWQKIFKTLLENKVTDDCKKKKTKGKTVLTTKRTMKQQPPSKKKLQQGSKAPKKRKVTVVKNQ